MVVCARTGQQPIRPIVVSIFALTDTAHKRFQNELGLCRAQILTRGGEPHEALELRHTDIHAPNPTRTPTLTNIPALILSLPRAQTISLHRKGLLALPGRPDMGAVSNYFKERLAPAGALDLGQVIQTSLVSPSTKSINRSGIHRFNSNNSCKARQLHDSLIWSSHPKALFTAAG